MIWDLSIIITIIMAAVLVGILAITLNDNHIALKFFFMLASFLILLIGLNTARGIAEVNSAAATITTSINTAYISLLWIFFLTFGYFLIYFIIEFKNIKAAKEKEEVI